MAHSGFVHLRVHSAYSLAHGAIRIGRLIEQCREQGMPAVAVTDAGNLFGVLEFALTATKAGVQPIVGCELALTRPDSGREQPVNGRNGRRVAMEPDQLVLLVQNETGYQNLLAIVSEAFLQSDPAQKPQIALERLIGRTDGLMALTGGVAGTVGRLLREGQGDAAETFVDELTRLFPDRLYVELQRHGLADESEIEDALVDLAYARDLPLVATNDVHYAEPEMFEAHDALICIAESARVDDENRFRLTSEHWLKPADQMRELFADLPEAVDNTVAIAQRCAFAPSVVPPMLPAYPTEAGRDVIDELRAQAAAGLEERLRRHVFPAGATADEMEGLADPYRQQLDYEIDVIAQMGFPGYFLIVSDFIRWAKGQGIPVGPGRGSGAGSLVAWSLQITDLDPLRLGLLFERFLNPERVSMPDFDIDFCQDRRDEVIAYVQGKYGHDRVAQIITFGKLQARAVLRDVGRVLGMPYGQVDRISKLVPYNPANPVGLQQAIDGEPALQEMRRQDPQVARLIDIALKLEGLYRHASTHAAGVVIGDRALHELVPLYRDPRSEMPVTQFNMKYVELAGLVKFDFLGLKTLTVLHDAVELLAAQGIDIDLLQLPLDDEATYALLGRGETAGVFQLEGSGMRDMLKRLKPNRFEDIIAVVSLYRPGPMENIPSYIDRKHGREKPDYLYPTLEPILKETHGIIIYQEQVMQIAQVLAGYSLGHADLLRRAMGKKNKAEMAAQRDSFVQGAVERGVPAAKATEIFDLVDKFAGYGFNKSHAAAYALVAFQTAYLKANYPVEFMAALMTHDMGSTDKLSLLKRELDRMETPLLPPDVNASGAKFTAETLSDGRRGIRYALAAIRNVGRNVVDAIVEARAAGGPFGDLFELAERIDHRLLNKRQIEALACAGAFDALFPDRARIVAGLEMLTRHAALAAEERQSDQVSLFGDDLSASATRPSLPDVEAWPEVEALRREFDAIGFYLSAHPLDGYRNLLSRLRVARIADLPERARREAGTVRFAGTVLGKQERTSAKGSRYAFVQLSDTSGMVEVTLFSEVMAQARPLLESGAPLLVTAEARFDDGNLRLTAQRIEDLERVAQSRTDGLRIYIDDDRPLHQVRQALERERDGRGEIQIVLGLDREQEVELTLTERYSVSPAIAAMLKAIPGVVDVQEVARL